MWNLGNIEKNIETIKQFFAIIVLYYIFIKIINLKQIKIKQKIIMGLTCIILPIITINIKYSFDTYHSIVLLILIFSIINSFMLKKDVIYVIVITIISFGVNYAIYSLALLIAFIPAAIFQISNDYINLFIIVCIYSILTYKIFKIKKVKNGIIFLQNKLEDSYVNILILNICVIILFLDVMFQDISFSDVIKTGTLLTIVIIYMILTIKQSFQLYYKQNLLVKEIEDTKKEVESKDKRIAELEQENLNFSKTSHSLAHKQKALEYKLNKLLNSSDSDNKEAVVENDKIKEELEDISRNMYVKPKEVELAKTDIPSIDNMLEYMQDECIKNNIEFELKVEGNIHYMVNHLIAESELEILLADHIKDAIIAVNSSDNSNKSILVRIGKIDDVYSLYIYDSGVEFTKEVLDKLGKEPVTTHKDNGGTGMGFMNTFDTLSKYKASLAINEIGAPCEDNYTKALIIKFDNQNNFNVIKQPAKSTI